MSDRKTRRKFSKEFKRELVEEYLSGRTSAEAIAEREGITAQFIYRWKTQVEQWDRKTRVETLESEGMSPEDARRMREMEEELADYKQKVAELTIWNDLLKKLHPNSQSEKKSSGYSELKRQVERSKKRAK